MIVVIYGLIISNILAAALAIHFRRKQKIRKNSIEANELLLDLMRGDALVRVSRVDPSDILLRSRQR